ncbi:TPA: hypothetical protein ACH3X2_004938 [Trebouxia sp. C0005]
MGNAFGWVPAQYPTPDAAGSVADYRLAEAAHALQQLPLDGLLLPLRLTQAQVYITYSALQSLCVPSRRDALLKTLTHTPDTILPACCKLYTALRHEAVSPTDLALPTSKDGSHDVILGHLTELQDAATSTVAQLEDLKAFLQQHPAVQVTADHEQGSHVSLPVESSSTPTGSDLLQSSADPDLMDRAVQRTPLTSVNLQVHQTLSSPQTAECEKENDPHNASPTAIAAQKPTTEGSESQFSQLETLPRPLAAATDSPGHPSEAPAASSMAAPMTHASERQASAPSVQSPTVHRSGSSTSLSSIGSANAGIQNPAARYTPRYAATYEEHLARCQGLGLSVLLHPHRKLSGNDSTKSRAKQLVL